VIDLNTTTRQFLLPEELCEIFLVSRRTIRRWIAEERIAYVQFRGIRRIPVDEVRRILQIHPPASSFPRSHPAKSASVA